MTAFAGPLGSYSRPKLLLPSLRRSGALLLAAIGLCQLGGQVTAAAQPLRPNIVFILADDLGWRDVGCFGSTFYETPHIDRLAARGVRLTQAYAASPLCSPTRASIMTGLYPARLGITTPSCHEPQVQLEKKLAPPTPRMRAVNALSVTRLKPDYYTLAEALHDAGYATAHFGKWHLGHSGPYEPKDQGFDLDFPHSPKAAGPGSGYLAPWKFIQEPPLKAEPGEHIEDRMSAEAARYIREHKDQPFYLNYWAFSVHSPWNARPDDVDYFKSRVDERNPQHNPLYAAMIKSLDDAVGRMLTAVDEAGIAERTIFVFFGDNGGFSYPPKKTDPAGFEEVPATSNLPLRSGKASLYEGGTREPGIVVWPGKVPGGTTNDSLLSSVDFYPTLLAMCGLQPKTGLQLDGMDQTPVLLGRGAVRDRVFCHFPHGTPNAARYLPGNLPGTYVHEGDWKLIRFFADNDDGSDRLELYNLQDDIGETKNVAGEHPALAAQLNEQISGFLRDTEAVVPVHNRGYELTAEQLAEKDPLKGWKARGCDAAVKDGVLSVTGKIAFPFLGYGAGQTMGPATLTMRVRAPQGGQGKIAWLPPGSKDTVDDKTVRYSLQPSNWQDVVVRLPAEGPLGIIRVYLPAQQQTVEVDWIELKPGPPPGRWDF